MSVWLELHVKGGGLAVLEVGMLGGLVSSGGILDVGTPQSPVRVVLRAGETIDVIGESIGGIMMRVTNAKREFKSTPGAVMHLDRVGGNGDRDDDLPLAD